MQQYLMGKESYWYHYIRLLPQPGDVRSLGIPIWWPDSDRKFLKGTNAEPAIETRRSMWREEWELGVGLLEDEMERMKYGYELYQWAATIFGSRSFRASLCGVELVLGDGMERVKEHLRKDRFSILFPILDIGNHDCADNAVWQTDRWGGE
jgi:hypothetical protein